MGAPEIRPVRDRYRIDTASKTEIRSFIDRCNNATLDVKIWANACGEFPLWAVQKAANWRSRGARDGNDLGHFLTDIRLAVGRGVISRKCILEAV